MRKLNLDEIVGLATVMRSLDRCHHGRHAHERCLSCPSGLSAGNPHLRRGQKIGYNANGEGLYVPEPHHTHRPDAWLQPPADITEWADEALNSVYRERHHLVAGYSRRWESAACPADDYPGMWIVFIESPAGQLSWHIPARDMDLFEHVLKVPEYLWDGHSTELKYARLKAACEQWEGKAA